MSRTAHLSPDDIELLRETVVFLVDEYRMTYGTIAEGADINRQTLRNFLEPERQDPRLRTLRKLQMWIGDSFVETGELPYRLRDRWEDIGWPGDSQAVTPIRPCNIRQLFPRVAEEEVHQVPDWFAGHFVIYRPAAVGGDFVRATLTVRPAAPNPTFENIYHDSNCAKHVTTGTVFNVGTALQLLGHVSMSSTLKLIVFEFPEEPDAKIFPGIVTSVDKRGRFFASRCVAKKLTNDSQPKLQGQEGLSMETGVFRTTEIADKPWHDEYESLADLLGNQIGDDRVMFLNPTSSGLSTTAKRRAGGSS